jgi:hypothetical protein
MKDKFTRIQAACKFNCRDVHDASILTLCEHPAAKACGRMMMLFAAKRTARFAGKSRFTFLSCFVIIASSS